MTQIILTASIILLVLYIIREYLIKLLTFIFDQFFGRIIDAFMKWLDPVTSFFSNSQSILGNRIDIFRVLGSLFLFALTIGLSVANYVLVFFGMELLIPGEIHLGAAGFPAAALASISVVLLELALGFILLELLGITDLLGWHSWPPRTKWILGIAAGVFLLMVIAGEAGVALYRIYQVGVEEPGQLHGIPRLMSQMPYWVTFLFAIGVPVVTAISAFSLRDMLLIVGWVVVTIPLIFCKILQLVLEILHSIITHIDDFLSAILMVLTWPIEILVSFIVFILVKLKVVPVLVLFVFLLLQVSGCGERTDVTTNVIPKNRFVVVLMDNSGSFRSYISRAVTNCERYVDSLSYGDAFTLLLIDAESLRGEKPPYVETTWLPIAQTHIVRKDVRAHSTATKDSIKRKVASIASLPRARATDLIGAIVRAAKLLTPDSAKFSRHLLIFSDMQDTRGQEFLRGTTLSGVRVRLLFVDVPSEQARRNVESWRMKLAELGAEEVLVFNPDQSETIRTHSLPKH